MKATARNIRQIILLSEEAAIARGAWEGRSPQDDANPARRLALKRSAVESRLRHRRWLAMFEVQGA